ncbi:hypothetical protein MAR_025492, partial [Mya arenaria]
CPSGDHLAICTHLQTQKPKREHKIVSFRAFRDISIDDLVTDITNSQTLQSIESTTEELVERYNTCLQELLDKHAPLQTKVTTIRPNTTWYNDSLRAAKRNRRKAERKMRKSNLTVHTEIYKEACIIYNKLMLQTKKDYYSSKIEENSNDRRQIFKLTNTLMGCKRDTVLPSTDNDKSLANKFCDFFIGKIISIRNKLSENQTDNDVLRADVNTALGQAFEPPRDLAELCTLSQFCNLTGEEGTVPPGYEPCCHSCACDSECGRRRDCCTDELDLYRLEEQNRSTCRSSVLHKNTSEPDFSFWYHMVDTCSDTTRSCKADDLYPWGSMFPHSSLIDGFVYYNEFCATCNTIFKLIPWRLAVACPQDGAIGEMYSVSYSYAVQKSLYGTSDDELGCFLYFIPPAEANVSYERCVPAWRTRRECNNDIIGTETEMQELQQKCLAFNATYRHYSLRTEQVYANVYCYLCAARNKPQRLCISQEERQKVNVDHSLVMILDHVHEVLEHAEDGSKTKDHCYQNVCRLVFCPEGQMNIAGRCKPVYSIIRTVCTMYLKLELNGPNAGFDVAALEYFANNDMQTHGLNGWDITLFVVREWNDTIPKYLVARLYKYFENGIISRIVTNVEQSISRHWKLLLRDKIWSFSVSFHKYTKYIDMPFEDANLVEVCPLWWFFFASDKLQTATERTFVYFHHWQALKKASRTARERTTELVITRAFFCQQVELIESEYIDLQQQIFLVKYNKTIEQGEFTRIREIHGTQKIRCLRSPFHYPDTPPSANAVSQAECHQRSNNASDSEPTSDTSFFSAGSDTDSDPDMCSKQDLEAIAAKMTQSL